VSGSVPEETDDSISMATVQMGTVSFGYLPN
jgi:hypothetical protein